MNRLAFAALTLGLLCAACDDPEPAADTGSVDATADTTTADTGADTTTADTGADTTVPDPPPAHTYAACDEVTSTDTLPTGIYTVSGAGCIGADPFDALELLCEDVVALADPAPVYQWSGVILVDDDSYARDVRVEGTAGVWFPGTCKETLGSGTCDGIATVLSGLLPDLAADCTDDATYGGCSCIATAVVSTMDAGTYTQTPGNFAISYLTKIVSDPAVIAQNYDIVNDSGDHWMVKTGVFDKAVDNMIEATHAATFTPCQNYCAHFVGGCQGSEDVPDVTPYADYDACLTQCADLTVTGAAQPVTTGDSLECRMYHVGAAVDPTGLNNLTTHCPHAQLVPTAVCVD